MENPDQVNEDKIRLWDIVIAELSKCKDVASIIIFVNNELSENIALKYADNVKKPWNQGYQGKNLETLIYHK